MKTSFYWSMQWQFILMRMANDTLIPQIFVFRIRPSSVTHNLSSPCLVTDDGLASKAGLRIEKKSL